MRGFLKTSFSKTVGKVTGHVLIVQALLGIGVCAGTRRTITVDDLPAVSPTLWLQGFSLLVIRYQPARHSTKSDGGSPVIVNRTGCFASCNCEHTTLRSSLEAQRRVSNASPLRHRHLLAPALDFRRWPDLRRCAHINAGYSFSAHTRPDTHALPAWCYRLVTVPNGGLAGP